MRIDFVTERHRGDLQRLHSYCFSLQQGEDWFEPGNYLGVFDGRRLVSSLKINPFEIFFCGRPVKMGGIGAVATLPEYRRRKLVAALFERALTVMRERGDIFSMLGPFSYEFYRKFGWELAFHCREYTVSVDDFAGFGGSAGRFLPLTAADLPRVKTIYEEYMAGYNGALKRSDNWWRYLLKKLEKQGFHFYGYENDRGQLEGYLFFQLSKGKMLVYEMIYLSHPVKEEFFRFFHLHNAQVETVVWKAPANDPSSLLLPEPPVNCRLVNGMMARVVDVKSALEHLAFPPDRAASFSLRVDDPWAGWNHNRCFQVRIAEGKATVQAEPENGEKTDLQCPVQSFSQLVLGYIGIKEGVELGRVILRDEKNLNILAGLFPAKTTFVNDWF
ncbi:MAG: GNAT family N-acetyltransferase [Firmicutes bacterium]|nr:GNAT family N-acetyltransferase [Bacillota bacterium]